VNRGERRALLHYMLRGYRLVASNARSGRYELDLILRRGGRLVVVEVKQKSGDGFGDPLEMIDEEKVRRVHAAAAAWVARHPQLAGLNVRFEAVGVTGRRVERVPLM
jgi:putative endonuclease